jgi:leader peptidase (prepilin peptidase)/N-methyltransferase
MFAVLGAVLGSFANAWAIRLLKDESIASGRSECPKCHHQLAWYDNIPLVGYLILGGRCRYCKKPISAQYPIVELGSATVFVALWLHFLPQINQQWVLLALWCLLSVFLIAAFITDWLELVLPDQYMIPAIVLAFGIAIASSFVPSGFVWNVLSARLIQAVIFATLYCVLYFGSRGRFIGDGDIRLAIVLGLALALPQLLVGVFAAYVIGAAIGVAAIATKLKTRKDIIAFGPFLILGLYFGLFFGQQIANWYLHFF